MRVFQLLTRATARHSKTRRTRASLASPAFSVAPRLIGTNPCFALAHFTRAVALVLHSCSRFAHSVSTRRTRDTPVRCVRSASISLGPPGSSGPVRCYKGRRVFPGSVICPLLSSTTRSTAASYKGLLWAPPSSSNRRELASTFVDTLVISNSVFDNHQLISCHHRWLVGHQ